MLYRSRAPLRIGLAGGGTDVAPYSDLYGGNILNVTISLFAYTTIELLEEPIIIFESLDQSTYKSFELNDTLPLDPEFALVQGVYHRVVKDYGMVPQGFKLTTHVDVPGGSGLGTSSTLVVSILGAFKEWLNLPLGNYDVAHLAYEIERVDLGLAGGKQDQYAATFGGVNFMEFFADDRVVVNPLRVKREFLFELEHNLLLVYTSTTRESAKIIKEQAANIESSTSSSVEATHLLKEQANMMKEAVLKGQLHKIGEILDYGFVQKRKLADGISNPLLEEFYEAAKEKGASGGKISGAGGGGFMIFYCPENTQYAVAEKLKEMGGKVFKYQIVEKGLTTWPVKVLT